MVFSRRSFMHAQGADGFVDVDFYCLAMSLGVCSALHGYFCFCAVPYIRPLPRWCVVPLAVAGGIATQVRRLW